MKSESDLGVVLIGRNEGERLRVSLRSLVHVPHRVYVDSGSTDGSQALAASMGFQVLELPTPPNFTAARARNAGLRKLLELEPTPQLVQMVDGDCEVDSAWIEAAAIAIAGDPRLGVVFGRRRERFPEASVYNMLCDKEWNVPVGEARSCGGDALFRVAALEEAGGYSPAMIAGEEPDLCLRMREKGWRIRRIDAEMTVHDANILRFAQWWKRTQRGGHAFAELIHRHGRRSDPQWLRRAASNLFWGGGIVASAVLAIAAIATGTEWPLYVAAAAITLFLAQTLRLIFRQWRRGESPRQALSWGVLMMVAKFAELQGMLQFAARRGKSARLKLIEYKS